MDREEAVERVGLNRKNRGNPGGASGRSFKEECLQAAMWTLNSQNYNYPRNNIAVQSREGCLKPGNLGARVE